MAHDPDTRYAELIEYVLDINIQPTANGNAYFKCPFHIDSRPSFGIQTRTGLWLCRSGCGEGNIEQLIMRAKQVDLLHALAIKRQWEEGSPLDVELDKMLAAIAPREAVAAPEPFVMSVAGLTSDRWPNWWPERGFDAKSWRRFDVRLDTNNGDTVLPLRAADGMLAGTIRRAQPGIMPKYRYSDNIRVNQHLYGIDTMVRLGWVPGSRLVLVEGSLDCIWLQQNGIAAAAVLGSHLSKDQARILRGVGPGRVLLAFDNDDAGRQATRKAMRDLPDMPLDVIDWSLRSDKKDVQEIKEPWDLKNIIDTPMSSLEYALQRR